ncbi:hypothetical protein ACFE04_002030 [Oxalis oulophora]
MLKGKKLKLPFPDQRLLSIVSGEEVSRSPASIFSDCGEELEVLHSIGFGPGRGVIDDEIKKQKLDGDDDDDDDGLESWARSRPEKDVSSSSALVSVVDVIAADEKRSDLEYELSQPEINLEKLQRIASSGLHDEGGVRATVWKLLLGYLPPSRDLWEKELTENRQKYVKLKEEILSSPKLPSSNLDLESRQSEIARVKTKPWKSSEKIVTGDDDDDDGPLKRHEISPEDHPLSLGKASVWHQYFEHTEIAEQIDRDLQRTHPDLKFFSGTSFSKKHKQAMRNILLLFSKLNPAIRYVQGMNEVLAPLYFVFSTDTDEQNAENAEADSFVCFVRLLSDSVDHFCPQLDNSSAGIMGTLSRLSEFLKANDEELWQHLEHTSKVQPQFYAFRWITLLLTQEFSFQSILRIWDSLLSNPFGVQDMLLRVCCAMLLCVKSRILSGDFAANLKLLQHYPDINIEHLLRVARDLTPDTSSFRFSP